MVTHAHGLRTHSRRDKKLTSVVVVMVMMDIRHVSRVTSGQHDLQEARLQGFLSCDKFAHLNPFFARSQERNSRRI